MSIASTSKGRTPIWQSIAADLRTDIAEGGYALGEKLPTEAALAHRFGVNRHTVRHAISQLVKEGLVRTRRGAGVFVAAQPTDYPIGKRVRFHKNLKAAGHEPRKETLSLETRGATQSEADILEIAPGAPILAYFGLSFSDNHPIAIVVSCFPLERLPDFENALRTERGITAAFEKVGIADYTRASTRLTATPASATQALHLQTNEGAPLLRSSSVNVAQDGAPIEFGKTWFVGDRVTLTLDPGED